MTEMEKLFEKMLNMEMTNREMYEQCRNVAHEPMTNEEWLRQANTEELADVIADFYLLGFTHGHNQMDITSRTKWKEWLKQPHTGCEP